MRWWLDGKIPDRIRDRVSPAAERTPLLNWRRVRAWIFLGPAALDNYESFQKSSVRPPFVLRLSLSMCALLLLEYLPRHTGRSAWECPFGAHSLNVLTGCVDITVKAPTPCNGIGAGWWWVGECKGIYYYYLLGQKASRSANTRVLSVADTLNSA